MNNTRKRFDQEWDCYYGKGTAEYYACGSFSIWCNGSYWYLDAPNGEHLYTARHLNTIINKLYGED